MYAPAFGFVYNNMDEMARAYYKAPNSVCIEQGTAEEIFAHPAHPYTIGLMASKPVVGRQVEKLYSCLLYTSRCV